MEPIYTIVSGLQPPLHIISSGYISMLNPLEGLQSFDVAVPIPRDSYPLSSILPESAYHTISSSSSRYHSLPLWAAPTTLIQVFPLCPNQ